MNTRPRPRRALVILIALVIGISLGCKGKTPTAPSNSNPPAPTTPPPPAAALYTLTGQVSSEGGGGVIAGANVSVVDGPNAGQTSNTDGAGRYTLTSLQFVGFTVAVSASGHHGTARGISLTAGSTTKTENFTLTPVDLAFGPGQHRVGSTIAAGRYYSTPSSGCYWERQSGFGGTLGEIIANEFVGFNAGQWIVDILASDRGFETDADCGSWFTTPRQGLQSMITPGLWRVGSQIPAGTYTARVGAGCYWERVRNFQGTLSAIIANDFIPNASTHFVTIRSSDAGFHNDGDCGTWTRTTDLTSVDDGAPHPSPVDIEQAWHLHRDRQLR